MKKTALITGITGQDGSYLAELLIEKDMKYMELYGVPPRSTPPASNTCISKNGCATCDNNAS